MSCFVEVSAFVQRGRQPTRQGLRLTDNTCNRVRQWLACSRLWQCARAFPSFMCVLLVLLVREISGIASGYSNHVSVQLHVAVIISTREQNAILTDRLTAVAVISPAA